MLAAIKNPFKKKHTSLNPKNRQEGKESLLFCAASMCQALFQAPYKRKLHEGTTWQLVHGQVPYPWNDASSTAETQ